jgi:hypothetical protein
LQKKFGEKIFKTLNFIAVFVKVMIFRNDGKILFLIFKNFKLSNLGAKSNFFDSFCLNFNVCTYKKTLVPHFGFKFTKIKNFC